MSGNLPDGTTQADVDRAAESGARCDHGILFARMCPECEVVHLKEEMEEEMEELEQLLRDSRDRLQGMLPRFNPSGQTYEDVVAILTKIEDKVGGGP